MFLNRITLIGFTGKEPKTAVTQSGKEITFVERRYPALSARSEWKEKTR